MCLRPIIGNEVTASYESIVGANRMRIASLLASSTEILAGLGLADQIVAISHECDYPPEITDRPRVTHTHIRTDAESRDIDTQVQDVTRDGGALYQLDTQQLADLRPDLIITQAQCDVCAVCYEDVVAAVRSTPALERARVVALNPTTLEDIFRDILRVGDATDRAEAARAYVADLRARVDAVHGRTADIPDLDRPRVACIEWIEPLMLAGNWMPELIRIAGGRCDLTRAGEHSGYTAWQDVVAWNPQVVVVCPCGFDLPRSLRESARLREYTGWQGISAAGAGCCFAVDGNALFNRSGPRMIDSLELLAALIHPARFGPLAEAMTAYWQNLADH